MDEGVLQRETRALCDLVKDGAVLKALTDYDGPLERLDDASTVSAGFCTSAPSVVAACVERWGPSVG
jgi:hypothetical protein